MAYTPAERETYYNFDDDSDIGHIYTCNKTLINKYDKYCVLYPDIYKFVTGDECSKTYTTKKKYISARAPKVISKEQKAKLSANAKERFSK